MDETRTATITFRKTLYLVRERCADSSVVEVLGRYVCSGIKDKLALLKLEPDQLRYNHANGVNAYILSRLPAAEAKEVVDGYNQSRG